MVDGAAVAVEREPLQVLASVARSVAGHGTAVLTLIVGHGVGADERRGAADLLRREHGELRVDVIDGGQASRYVVGAE